MTIGIDGSRAFIEGRTGTENYSYQLIKALAKIDTENTYLIYLRKGQGSRVKNEEWPGNFKFQISNFKFLWTQVGLALRTFIDPIDVLFVPAHTLPLIRRPGLRTVITVHDLGAEYLPAFHQLKQVLYLKLMTHYQLKTASRIIAVSEATKKDLIKKVGVAGKKIDVVYEGVAEEFKISNLKFKINVQNRVLIHYGLEKKLYFLFVGTVQPRKNLERLIRAFAQFLTMDSGEVSRGNDSSRKKSLNTNPLIQIPEFKLVLVGSKGWKSEAIYALPKELGIEDNVKFLGRISDEELVSLYRGATALTYPSLFEGFGLPIVEAFECGCPVITSDISSMPEIAGEAAILVNPYNIEEITKALSSVASDDILRSSLIKKGRLRSRDFDWKVAAERTLKVIKGIDK